jgi:hypothetical protein
MEEPNMLINRKSQTILTALTTFSIYVSSCGKSNQMDLPGQPGGPTESGALAFTGAMDRSYKSECRMISNTLYEDEVITFYTNSFDRTFYQYDGASCNNGPLRLNVIKRFDNVLRYTNSSLEGWTDITYSVSKLTLTPLRDEDTKELNKKSAYGYSDWANGSAKDITGKAYSKDFDPMPKRGETIQSTIRVQGKKLFMARYTNDRPSDSQPYVYAQVEEQSGRQK